VSLSFVLEEELEEEEACERVLRRRALLLGLSDADEDTPDTDDDVFLSTNAVRLSFLLANTPRLDCFCLSLSLSLPDVCSSIITTGCFSFVLSLFLSLLWLSRSYFLSKFLSVLLRFTSRLFSFISPLLPLSLSLFLALFVDAVPALLAVDFFLTDCSSLMPLLLCVLGLVLPLLLSLLLLLLLDSLFTTSLSAYSGVLLRFPPLSWWNSLLSRSLSLSRFLPYLCHYFYCDVCVFVCVCVCCVCACVCAKVISPITKNNTSHITYTLILSRYNVDKLCVCIHTVMHACIYLCLDGEGETVTALILTFDLLLSLSFPRCLTLSFSLCLSLSLSLSLRFLSLSRSPSDVVFRVDAELDVDFVPLFFVASLVLAVEDDDFTYTHTHTHTHTHIHTHTYTRARTTQINMWFSNKKNQKNKNAHNTHTHTHTSHTHTHHIHTHTRTHTCKHTHTTHTRTIHTHNTNTFLLDADALALDCLLLILLPETVFLIALAFLTVFRLLSALVVEVFCLFVLCVCVYVCMCVFV